VKVFDDLSLPEDYRATLRDNGIGDGDMHVIRRGKDRWYSPHEYHDVCSKSRLMICFSESESQGIAWAEAWSMDVPTLIWRNERKVIDGKETHVSTAPYLTPQTGRFFNDTADLSRLLGEIGAGEVSFAPRRWVLEYMSDEVCAGKLLELAGIPLR